MEFVLKYLTSNNDGDFFKKSGREGYVGLRAVVLLWVVFRSLRPLTYHKIHSLSKIKGDRREIGTDNGRVGICEVEEWLSNPCVT